MDKNIYWNRKSKPAYNGGKETKSRKKKKRRQIERLNEHELKQMAITQPIQNLTEYLRIIKGYV